MTEKEIKKYKKQKEQMRDLNGNTLSDPQTAINTESLAAITNDVAGGIYAGTSDGNLIIGDTSGSLVPNSGVGNLTVPANTFTVGASYHLVCSGDIPQENKNDQVTLELTATSGAVVVPLCSVTVDLETSSGESYFELECDFTFRSTGSQAEILTSCDFTFNKKLEKDFKGTRKVQSSTIDSTTEQTIGLTCTITGATTQLLTRLFYLRRQY